MAAAESNVLLQREQRLAEADRLLEKFPKEYPDHPAGAPALISQADEILQKAHLNLSFFRAAHDADEKEEYRKYVRDHFARATDQLIQIQENLKVLLDT